jgi:hypothetical protein
MLIDARAFKFCGRTIAQEFVTVWAQRKILWTPLRLDRLRQAIADAKRQSRYVSFLGLMGTVEYAEKHAKFAGDQLAMRVPLP